MKNFGILTILVTGLGVFSGNVFADEQGNAWITSECSFACPAGYETNGYNLEDLHFVTCQVETPVDGSVECNSSLSIAIMDNYPNNQGYVIFKKLTCHALGYDASGGLVDEAHRTIRCYKNGTSL